MLLCSRPFFLIPFDMALIYIVLCLCLFSSEVCDLFVSSFIPMDHMAALSHSLLGFVPLAFDSRSRRARRASATQSRRSRNNVAVRGQCALNNLGNSCFLSSVIQVISHGDGDGIDDGRDDMKRGSGGRW